MVAVSFWTRVIFGLLFFSVKGVWPSRGSAGKEPTCQVGTFESRGWAPGWEDPLEAGLAAHPRVLARGFPDGLQFMGSQSRTWPSDWTQQHTATSQRLCVKYSTKGNFVTLSDFPSHIYKSERSLSQTLSNSRFGKCGRLNYMLCEP